MTSLPGLQEDEQSLGREVPKKRERIVPNNEIESIRISKAKESERVEIGDDLQRYKQNEQAKARFASNWKVGSVSDR